MISLKAKDFVIENIETVLFDKDGTFIDLDYFWGKMTELRALEVIKRFNLKEENKKELCLMLGFDIESKKMLKDGITALYSRSKIIEIFKNDLLKFNIQIQNEDLAQIFDEVSMIFYQDMMKYTKPIEDAIDFIKKLRKKGLKLAIVTSDSIESTKLTLKHFAWENLFDCAVGRESSNKTKESGALTKIALDELRANPKTTLMIGDAPMDFMSAKNADVENVILVSTGQLDKQELLKTCFNVVESLNEIEIL